MVSTSLSIISLSLSSIQQVVVEKNNFLSLTGKLIVLTFGTLSTFVRLFAIFLFFAPSVGLINLLMHWKMGQIETKEFISFDVINGEIKYFDEAWNTTPNYTDYTIVYLWTYFVTFLCLIFLHYILVYGVKLAFAQGFRSKNELFEKMFHVSTQMFIPSNYKDRDDDESQGENKSCPICSSYNYKKSNCLSPENIHSIKVETYDTGNVCFLAAL